MKKILERLLEKQFLATVFGVELVVAGLVGMVMKLFGVL